MDIKSIIKEQREELERIEKKERIIERDRLKEAKSYLSHPNILVITGIRRCGKSIFSYLIEKNNNFAYINFDDERLSTIKGEELDKILEAFYELYGDIEYLVLDEIQNVPKWELFANRLRRTKKVILTGSNSNLLSGELATHLTGRYIEIILFPFSFKEYLRFKDFNISSAYTTEERAKILNYLNEFLSLGGIPESYTFGRAILSRIYEDILTKDILLRYGIKKIEDLKRLARYVITNSSDEISYSKLAKILGVKHVSTISNWIFYLENSFLIFKLERFDFKLKQQFIAPKKIYCIDTGLIDTIGFKFSENKGKIIENAVAIELQRNKAANKDLEVYYWKDHQQNETDFVIKEKNKVTNLIQVTFASNKEDIKEREINSLIKASDSLKCENLTIITWNYESKDKIDGQEIRFIPLWKWLLRA